MDLNLKADSVVVVSISTEGVTVEEMDQVTVPCFHSRCMDMEARMPLRQHKECGSTQRAQEDQMHQEVDQEIILLQ
jgi:hypothetical protein